MESFELRGFAGFRFRDCNGEQCSVQESSSMESACLWLGRDGDSVQYLSPDGWKSAMADELAILLGGREVLFPDRMHLNQDQVRELLPVLEYFAERGVLPPQTERCDIDRKECG